MSRDEAARWLTAAREDLAFAEYAAAGDFHPQACFHSQQAAEKAVKAMHFARGARAVLGHNVRSLMQRLDPMPRELAVQLDGARELDLFYVPTRYPNGLDEGSPGEAFSAVQSQRALGIAQAIVEGVERASRAEPPS